MSYHNLTTMRVAVNQGIATVTFDNGPINLLDIPMIVELDSVTRALEADAAVRVVLFQSANPDFFIAHADVTAIQQLPAEPAPREEKLGLIHAALDRLRSMPKVTIAKIEGRCRGAGSELALACDMRFAAIGRGVLCQPEVGVGIIPGAGGSVRLPRLVGRGRALEIILGSGDFSAEVAERYGYINRALPAAEIDHFVTSLATRIASFPAQTLALAKQAVALNDRHLEDDLAQEETLFLQAANLPRARARMDAAMAMGMQQPVMEKCCFTHVWGPLAGV
ncbi:MAG: enoyl-CoA hydratase/isomerase family protein [Pseudomonadota bacterium]